MVKKLNPSFVGRLANKLKDLLSNKTATISADQFQGEVTEAANKYLNDIYGVDPSAARSAIAQSTPEAECAKAIKARAVYNILPVVDDRISHYKTQTEIGNVTRNDFLKATGDHPEVKEWISKTNMLLFDANAGKMRQKPVPFNIVSAVYCGKCWICNTDVMSYTGISTTTHIKAPGAPGAYESGTTPCGDCEHVSAIMASYIAGMLTSGGFANVYWASYYVACVECNRRKSNFIGVKLNATDGWQVDDSGVNAIVDAIFPMNGVDQHASEYNPIRNALSDKYNGMTPDEKIAHRLVVKGYIEAGTETWCKVANDNMNKATASTKHIKMSFNVSKIIVAITGHLNIITGPLEKRANKAKPGPGKASATGKKQGKVVKSSQSAQLGSKLPPPPRRPPRKTGGGPFDNHDEYSYIVHWNNLLDNEDEYEDEYEDEDDVTFEARMLKYRNVMVDYISTIYGQRLFEQYQSDTETFEELMINLSKSMNEVLEPIPDIEPGEVASSSTERAGEKSTFVFPPTAPSTPPTTTKETMEVTPIKTGKPGDSPMQIPGRTVTDPEAGSVYAPLTQPRGTATTKSNEDTPANVSIFRQVSNPPTMEVTPIKTGKPDDSEVDNAKSGVKRLRTVAEELLKPEYAADSDVIGVSHEDMAKDIDDAADSGDAQLKWSRSNETGANFVGENSQASQEEDDNKLSQINPSESPSNKTFQAPAARSTPVVENSPPRRGGSRLNKSHSKNRTKRVSYIKHKQTRKNTQNR
jgi:hypothetical protein